MQKSWKPLILLTVGVVIIITLLFSNTSDSIGPGCETIRFSRDVGETFNLVFLADNYNDISAFTEDVGSFSNALLNLRPFNTYQERFNIYTIKNTTTLNCKYDDAVICDDGKAKREASKCPHDFIIILSHRNKIVDVVDPLRSAAYLNIASINTADNPLVLAHEFGHLFGDFAEEYIADYKIDWDAPNCDNTISCKRFQIVQDSGCFNGCTTHDYSRSIERGLMRSYWNGESYGPYNEYILETLLQQRSSLDTKLTFSPFRKSQSNNKPNQVIILDFSIKNNAFLLTNKEIIDGYAPNFEKEGYSYVLLSPTNTNLYNFSFGSPRIIQERDSESGMNGSITSLGTFTLIVPYSKEVSTIKIKDPNNNDIAEFSLTNTFSLTPGQTATFKLKDFYKEIYFYNEQKQLQSKITLDCKDYCHGTQDVEYIIPDWPTGNYFLMYYSNGEWNRINFQVI